MKIKRIAILVLLLVTLTAGSTMFLSTAEQDSTIVSDPELDGVTLTIVTRHDVTITDEFTARFLATPEAIAADIDVLDFRYATTDDGWKKYLEDPAKSVDIAWGGGPALFNTMENWGLLYHIDPVADAALFTIINDSVPMELAGAGMKKYAGEDLVWAANAISSFGFTVNHDFLDLYGLPIPETWEELATPTYYISDSVKAISMGDPPLTTSNTRIYQIILQAFGWDEGWKIITRMGANAGIYPGSGDTRGAVVSGEVGIAMTIDFYGTIANRENPACEYIIPEGQSIVNGDPIAMGIHVDDYDEAAIFLEYVTSPAGQTAWMTEGLDRLPVNDSAFYTPEGSTYTELWALYNETLANKGIDFDEELSTNNLDTTIYYFHNTITQKHNLLRRTWGTLVTQYRDLTINATQFLDLSNQLGVPGMTQNQSLDWNTQYQTDAIFAADKDAEWREYAADQYCDILEVLGDPCSSGPDPTETETETETDPSPFGFIPALMASLIIATVTLIYKRKKR